MGRSEKLMGKIQTYLRVHPDANRTSLRRLAGPGNRDLFASTLQALVDNGLVEESVWEYTYPKSRTYRLAAQKEEAA